MCIWTQRILLFLLFVHVRDAYCTVPAKHAIFSGPFISVIGYLIQCIALLTTYSNIALAGRCQCQQRPVGQRVHHEDIFAHEAARALVDYSSLEFL